MINLDLVDNAFAYDFINECPHCNKGIRINILKIHIEEFDGTKFVNLICQCPLCHEIFFAQYDFEMILDPFGFPKFRPEPIYYPSKQQIPVVEKEIETLSPNFLDAFRQATMIEQLKYSDLAGLAYRRAFEFLIKDYVISLMPDKEEEIINDSSVSNIINNRIPETREFVQLKEISKRVWWLGSDYAHYKKHYIDKDILDLKQCIDIVKYQIVMNLRYNHQVASIKKNRKKTKQNR